ncbi:hypothetical protein SCHPADRAFT_897438 [Schizopora paradoxa]|uniref:Uncharacterized protein n=1 Tax=Schizopora paradoxa TaxID=27342 RepID=A0A0H2RGA0_9AGAM|nr:hypothetical protein SCHPADRAFT_897438 [Schizopora paradoxa]
MITKRVLLEPFVELARGSAAFWIKITSVNAYNGLFLWDPREAETAPTTSRWMAMAMNLSILPLLRQPPEDARLVIIEALLLLALLLALAFKLLPTIRPSNDTYRWSETIRLVSTRSQEVAAHTFPNLYRSALRLRLRGNAPELRGVLNIVQAIMPAHPYDATPESRRRDGCPGPGLDLASAARLCLPALLLYGVQQPRRDHGNLIPSLWYLPGGHR